MDKLQTFNFEDLPVRTLTVNEEPYFVGKDVVNILGYKMAVEISMLMSMLKIS